MNEMAILWIGSIVHSIVLSISSKCIEGKMEEQPIERLRRKKLDKNAGTTVVRKLVESSVVYR